MYPPADYQATGILDSQSLWLWRRNDETRKREKNTKVATDIAYAFEKDIASRIKN